MSEAPPIPAAERKKRVFVRTYGCQMNVYDSQRMVERLSLNGYEPWEREDEADLVILNTCHIREKATEKVFSELGRLRRLKEQRAAAGEPMTLAVAGCVAQAEGAEIIRRQGAVDIVVGPQAYHELAGLLARREGPAVAAQFRPRAKFDALGEERQASGVASFLTVQEGCDKFCAFCVVPYTRGAEYSRPSAEILAEARSLVEGGARQVTLLGQNVNAYRSDTDLAGLIRALAVIPGLERIRYTTSHPRDMSEALIAAHAEVEALMPYLHLPVQSGSDRILKAMNRGHTARHYVRLAEEIRAARPDIALSSDFIVGFPGETEADFRATLALIEEVGFASAFSFKYSRRPGTPAAGAAAQVEEGVKIERLAELQALLDRQRNAFNTRLVGARTPILIEKGGRKAGQVMGRTPWLQAVHCNGPLSLVGEVREAAITACHANSLAGRLVAAAA